MKRILLVLAAVACLGISSTTFAADEYDVSQVRWGMTKDEVKKAENAKPTNKNNILIREEHKCKILYFFESEKLTEVSYFFIPGSIEESSLLFSKLRKILTNKYGNNENEEFNAIEGLEKFNSFMQRYKTKNTQIILANTYVDYQTVTVTYSDKKEKERRDTINKKMDGETNQF